MPPLHLQRATMKKQINRSDRFGILPSVCRVFAEVWLKFSFMSGKKNVFSFDCTRLGQYNGLTGQVLVPFLLWDKARGGKIMVWDFFWSNNELF